MGHIQKLNQGLCVFFLYISVSHVSFTVQVEEPTSDEPDIYTRAAVCPHRFHMGCMLDVLEKSCTATQALEACVNKGDCNEESLGEVGRIISALEETGEEALWKCCCTKAFEYGYENCKNPNPSCKVALDEEVMKSLKEDNADIQKCMKQLNKDACKTALDAVKKIRDNVQRARGRLRTAKGCDILAPAEPLSDCGFDVKPEPRALARADLYCDTIIWQMKEMGASDPFMAQCPGAPKMPEKKQEEEGEDEPEGEEQQQGEEQEDKQQGEEQEDKQPEGKEDKQPEGKEEDEKPKADEPEKGDDIYSKAASCPHRFHMGCLLDVLEKTCEATRELDTCLKTEKCPMSEFSAFVGAIDPKGEESVFRCCCTKAYKNGGYEKCKNPDKKCISAIMNNAPEGDILRLFKKCIKRKTKKLTCKKALVEALEFIDRLQRIRGEMHSVKGCDILAPMEPLSKCGWDVKPNPRALERKDLYCDTIIWQFKEMGAGDDFMSQCPGAPKPKNEPEPSDAGADQDQEEESLEDNKSTNAADTHEEL